MNRADLIDRLEADRIVTAYLAEHKRLSDLFVHYNSPGSGAHGFSEQIRHRLRDLEASIDTRVRALEAEGARDE